MAGAADTPMMRQYLGLKAQVPDALLLYRMGDFYELFFEDARQAAEILELTLTSRNKQDPDPIPMAGVPYHALETYLGRLVDAGRKVAIAEQGAEVVINGKKIMERELVRVVTPGVPWAPDGLEAREPHYLAGVTGSGPVGLAFLDVSTGELRITHVADAAAAAAELVRMEPREVVLDARLADDEDLRAAAATTTSTAPDPAWFDGAAAVRNLCDALGVHDLTAFGADPGSAGVAAAGALVTYVRDTARVDLKNVRRLVVYDLGGQMVLDEATRRNLELLRPLHGTGRKGTLVGLLDRCCTPMGSRLLRQWVRAPLVNRGAIERRLDAVEALSTSAGAGAGAAAALRRDVRTALRTVADLERLGGKAAQGTASARDLVALATSLRALPAVRSVLQTEPSLSQALPQDVLDALLVDVADDVHTWVVDEPPLALTEGGVIRSGAHAELDELTLLSREGKGAIARMESREREDTGINSLKVKHNKVFGYFIEVTQANYDKVPDRYIRKQTLANCERYITPELKEFEEKVLGADERRKTLEYELFRQLRDRIGAHVGALQRLAAGVAWLDVVASLAEVAVDRRYVRPSLHDGVELRIIGGRHPVVESMPLDEPFVPNDVTLDERARLVVLTGPNMAGKSTVMRQVALIALMAQLGSFVPATQAHVGVCDRIFVRVGASDDLSKGRSTFMVEMSETALILNQATPRSLVLLDEIGRGTSTYDGLAIAWAVAEAVHDTVRARCIFATHYHELVALADQRPAVDNLHVAVSEWGERIVFLRTLRAGGASKSYGIQCARLAGMPADVITRSRELLTELERRPDYGPPTAQLHLFGGAAPAPEPTETAPPVSDPVHTALAELEPDTMTPRAALDAIYALRDLLPALLMAIVLAAMAVGPGAAAATLDQVRVFTGRDHARILLVADGDVGALSSRSSPASAGVPAQALVSLRGLTSSADERLEIHDDGVQRVLIGPVDPGLQVTIELEQHREVSAQVIAAGAVLVELRVPGAPVDHGLPTPEQLEAWVEGVSLVRAVGGPPRAQRVVVLDPGHGGWDHGAVGVSGTREADVALELARRTRIEMQRTLGLEVILTRDTDVFIPLQERAAIANRADADVFVSIHANAVPHGPLWGTERSGWGIETYSLDTASDAGAARVARRENILLEEAGAQGETLFGQLLSAGTNRLSSELAAEVQAGVTGHLAQTYGNDQVRDLGTKTALFYVLHSTRMPSILFESSFVSHPIDERRLRAPHWQAEVAAAISAAVGRWLGRQG